MKYRDRLWWQSRNQKTEKLERLDKRLEVTFGQRFGVHEQFFVWQDFVGNLSHLLQEGDRNADYYRRVCEWVIDNAVNDVRCTHHGCCTGVEPLCRTARRSVVLLGVALRYVNQHERVARHAAEVVRNKFCCAATRPLWVRWNSENFEISQ